MWEEWGIFYFFEHSEGKHRLVLYDSMGAIKPLGDAYAALRYEPPTGRRLDEEHIQDFSVSHALTMGAVTSVDYDYTLPRADLKVTREDPRDTGLAHQEHYTWGDYLTSDSAAVGSAMLICSELSAEAQARQLARHVVITLDDDSRALLRFADPAVFVHLLWVLPLPHLASLCDGASRWWVPFQGLWYELEFSGRPEALWSKLDEFQSIALTNVGLVNDALATMPEPLDIKQMWRRSQEINQWLGAAQSEFGLVNAHDCVAFARHGYLLGGGFSNHPKLVPHLRNAVAMPGLYAQATALFSEKEWNNVIADIERINQKQGAS